MCGDKKMADLVRRFRDNFRSTTITQGLIAAGVSVAIIIGVNALPI